MWEWGWQTEQWFSHFPDLHMHGHEWREVHIDQDCPWIRFSWCFRGTGISFECKDVFFYLLLIFSFSYKKVSRRMWCLTFLSKIHKLSSFYFIRWWCFFSHNFSQDLFTILCFVCWCHWTNKNVVSYVVLVFIYCVLLSVLWPKISICRNYDPGNNMHYHLELSGVFSL